MVEFLKNPGAVLGILVAFSWTGRLLPRLHRLKPGEAKLALIESLSLGSFLCLDAVMMMVGTAVVKTAAHQYEASTSCLMYALIWGILFFVISAIEYEYAVKQPPDFWTLRGVKTWVRVWIPVLVGAVLVFVSMKIILGLGGN